MSQTIRIRFDGYKKDWKVPEGFLHIPPKNLHSYLNSYVFLIGQRTVKRSLVPWAYGPHKLLKINEHTVRLRNRLGREFEDNNDGLLIINYYSTSI